MTGRKPDKFGDTVIVSYRDASDSTGKVLWDGEAHGLGIQPAHTWPPVRKTPPAGAQKP
jgi:hypothetical protein